MTYDDNTPEWQLNENYKTQQLLIAAYNKDIARYTDLRNLAQQRADKYATALLKLDNKWTPDA